MDRDAGTIVEHARQSPDQPIQSSDEDRLGHEDFADAIAAIADSQKTEPPYNVAVAAPWGAGKSSLLNAVHDILIHRPPTSSRTRTLVARFDAWAHDDAVDIKAELYQAVLRKAAPARQLRSRLQTRVPRRAIGKAPMPIMILRGLRAWSVTFGVIGIAYAVLFALLLRGQFFAFVSVFMGQTLAWLLESLAWLASAATTYFAIVAAFVLGVLQWYTRKQSAFYTLAQDIPTVPSDRVDSLRTHLHSVLADIPDKRRVVVFLENLDRCRPKQMGEVLEAIRQVLDSPRVVIIAALDTAVVSRSLAQLDNLEPAGAKSLIAKTFDLRFDLPIFSPRALPEALSGDSLEPAREESIEVSPFEEIKYIAASFFVPTLWAWKLDKNARLSVKTGGVWEMILSMSAYFALLPATLRYFTIEDQYRQAYPRIYRDQEAPITCTLLLWSIPPLLATGLILYTLGKWLGATVPWSTPGLVLFLYLFATLVHPLSVNATLRLLYRRDEAHLVQFRQRRERGEADEGKLPVRLRHARLMAVEREIKWHQRLNESSDIKAIQFELLSQICLTPREFKHWNNRLRITLAMSQQRQVLHGDEYLPLWCRWTLLQERHPSLTESVARSCFEPEGVIHLGPIIDAWPQSEQEIWRRVQAAAPQLSDLLLPKRSDR